MKRDDINHATRSGKILKSVCLRLNRKENSKMTKRTLAAASVAAAALALLFSSSTPLRAEHKHSPEVQERSGANPLIEEMRRLDTVFKEIVSGVALGDGVRVHRAIETMHGAREKTEEALHAGEIKPPKNSGKLEKFEMMDKEFHGDLEKLAEAASKDDRTGMLRLTKKLMDGCVRCHAAYRK